MSDDPTRYRTDEEVSSWQKKDPLIRLRKYLEKKGLWNSEIEEETIDAKAVENLHKYGTTKAPVETEAPAVSPVDELISMPSATEESKTSSTESDVQS